MTLEIVPTDDYRSGVHVEVARTAAVPLTEEQRQLRNRPARNRVTCSQCGRQINPSNAIQSDEGLICATHGDD